MDDVCCAGFYMHRRNCFTGGASVYMHSRVNWQVIDRPQLLDAIVETTNTSPDWLSVHSMGGGSLIALSSDQVAAGAAALTTVTVSITHKCRGAPWVGTFVIVAEHIEPLFIDKPASVNACPEVQVNFKILVGSCPTQTLVSAMLTNGTALPVFLHFAYESGELVVVGNVPRGTEVLEILGVAQLGNRTFRSAPVNITRIADSVPSFGPPSQLEVRACPYVSVVFPATPATCGATTYDVMLADGSPPPAFLRYSSTSNSVTVFGVVPETYATLSIVAVWAANHSVRSDPVTITRPPFQGSVTASAEIDSATSAGERTTKYVVLTAQLKTVAVSVLYGIPFRVRVSINETTAQGCNSFQFFVTDSWQGSGNSGNGLPVWASASLSQTSAVVTGAPTKSVAPGTNATFYIWVNDGQNNPALRVDLTVGQSLQVTTSGANLSVSSVAPIVTLIYQLPILEDLSCVLICPPDSSTNCNYNYVTRAISTFGTPEGINEILAGVRVASAQVRTGNVTVVLSDNENPNSVLASIPIANIPRYEGVALRNATQNFVLDGKVGKQSKVQLPPFFKAGTVISFSVSRTDWLQVVDDTLEFTPLAPSALVLIALRAADKYTSIDVNVTINVSFPLPPVASETVVDVLIITGEPLTFSLSPNAIIDPEGGLITYQARLVPDKALPTFMSFDSALLSFSGTPSPADVGEYKTVITGSTRSGPQWTGNASVYVTFTVARSWADFFAAMYEIVGYVGSALTVLATLWVRRSHVRNTLYFGTFMRASAPGDFLMGSYVFRCPGSEEAIHRRDVKAVHVHQLSANVAPWWYSAFGALQSRKVDTGVITDESKVTGISWISISTFGNRNITVTVDAVALRKLKSNGDVDDDTEFLLKVVRTGRLKGGFVMEAFCFTVRAILNEQSEMNCIFFNHQDGAIDDSTVSNLATTPEATRMQCLEELVQSLRTKTQAQAAQMQLMEASHAAQMQSQAADMQRTQSQVDEIRRLLNIQTVDRRGSRKDPYLPITDEDSNVLDLLVSETKRSRQKERRPPPVEEEDI